MTKSGQQVQSILSDAINSRFTVTVTCALLIVGVVVSMYQHQWFLTISQAVVLAIFITREIFLEKRQQERLDTILDAATELAIITTDLDGNIAIFNKGAERMLGYEAKDMQGKHFSRHLHDPVELKNRASELDVLSDEVVLLPARTDTPVTQDWTFVSKDGRQVVVSLAFTKLRRQAGKVVGFLGIAADVTQRRDQEQERERLLWLEQELTEKLVRQNDELMRMDRTKDEFVATVSHEFRTPLTSIKGYLETLIDGDAGNLNDTQVRFLQIIERSADRLGRLVEDLLFAARVDSGGTSVAVFTEVDIAELFAETIETAHPHARAKGIELNHEVDGSIVVAADPARLVQLLANLTNNALKFTPKGGRVTLSAHVQDGDAHICVEDTGMGIPVDEQPRLFQRFFRSTLAQQQAIDGTGIGLAVVKEIADAHGAKLSVQSTVGVGTTVQLTLPALDSIEMERA